MEELDDDDDLEVEEDIKNIKNLYGKLEMILKTQPQNNSLEVNDKQTIKKKNRMAVSQGEVREKTLYIPEVKVKYDDNTTNKKDRNTKNKRNINISTIENQQTNNETLNYLETKLNINNKLTNKEEKKNKIIKEKAEKFNSNELYVRAILHKEKAIKLIEEKKKQEIDKELSACLDAPVMNEKSKKIMASNHAGMTFFERLELTKEGIHKKKQKLLIEKEEKLKKELEEIEQKRVIKDQTEICEKVSKLYNWKKKKEKKLDDKKKEIEKTVEKVCTFKPEINKKSEKISKNPNNYSEKAALTDRLYEIDIAKRKENRKALESIYSHYFTPMTNRNDDLENLSDKKIQKTLEESSKVMEKYKTIENDEDIAKILREKIVFKSKLERKSPSILSETE